MNILLRLLVAFLTFHTNTAFTQDLVFSEISDMTLGKSYVFHSRKHITDDAAIGIAGQCSLAVSKSGEIHVPS